MTRVKRLDAGRIARTLAMDAEGFCRRFFPDGRRVGNYWQIADTNGGAGRSLCIRLRAHGGRRAGKWVDHATGEFGDLLDLLCHQLNPAPFTEVLRYASSYLGDPDLFATLESVSGVRSDKDGSRASAGCRLFKAGRPIINTPAERYLRSRSITRFGSCLAYHPTAFLRANDGCRLEYPALLAAIQDTTGRTTGCVRLFLNRETDGLADIDAPKRVIGDLYQNGVRFGPWQTANDLIVGEGLESTLSVGTVLTQAALTACITANHLSAFVWPETARRIWIAHDNGDVGECAAGVLRDRVQTSGRQAVLLSPLQDDFNTDLQLSGAERLYHRLASHIATRVTDHDLWPERTAA